VDCIELDRPLLLLESQSGPLTHHSRRIFPLIYFRTNSSVQGRVAMDSHAVVLARKLRKL
jgi:hypothetical protein